MSQSKLLIDALKQLLKIQNLTYAMVAKHLSMSEASVKRMFSKSQLTLARIDEICEMMGLQISDLLQKMQSIRNTVNQLTYDQEKKIVSDRKLCLVTVCVINHWTMDEILRYFNLTEHECIQYLAELDKLKLIELLPSNRIKLLVSSGFSWMPNGPIQKFFQQYVLNDYMNSNFQSKDEEIVCQFGMLTLESQSILRKKIRHLMQEFVSLCEQDASEPITKRFGNVCFILNRPWATSTFNEFIKPELRALLLEKNI